MATMSACRMDRLEQVGTTNAPAAGFDPRICEHDMLRATSAERSRPSSTVGARPEVYVTVRSQGDGREVALPRRRKAGPGAGRRRPRPAARLAVRHVDEVHHRHEFALAEQRLVRAAAREAHHRVQRLVLRAPRGPDGSRKSARITPPLTAAGITTSDSASRAVRREAKRRHPRC